MQALTSLHPSEQILWAFANGQLDAASAESVTTHLDGCQECLLKVAGISSDGFLDAFRRAGELGLLPYQPDAATAARYVADGYLWNSGNFLFRAEDLLAELNRFEPAMVAAVEGAIAEATSDIGFLRLDRHGLARRAGRVADHSSSAAASSRTAGSAAASSS